MLRFRCAGATHNGLVRPHNEDAGFVGPYLLLVADGVGGSVAGEIAAASTAYVVTSVATISDLDEPLTLLADAVQLAHAHLVRGGELDPTRRGMSTTLTALLCDGHRVALAHLGDSRAYRWRNGELTRLSTDHTLVQSLIDDGHLTEEDAAFYPYRSVVMKALDGEHLPEPDIGWVDVEIGDQLLVCSDGLSDLVDDQTIASVLTAAHGAGNLQPTTEITPDDPGLRDGDRDDLDRAVAQLIDAALAAGGRDNVTCVLGEVVLGRSRPFGRTLGAFSPTNLIDGAAVRIVHTGEHRRVRLEPA